MTLLELLRQELPKRGGWPEGAACVVQSLIDGELYFYDRRYDGNGAMLNLRRSGYKFCKASDIGRDDMTGLLTPVITRKQYEAAGWDGTGLPPVGCECEYSRPPVEADSFGSAWKRCFIRYASFRTVVIQTHNDELSGHPSNFQFRPLRTEAEQKRGAAVGAIFDVICKSLTDESESTSFAIYDAIAAGKIPGVKLEV